MNILFSRFMDESHHVISIISINNHVPFCFALEVKPCIHTGSVHPIIVSATGEITVINKKIIPFSEVSLDANIYLAKSFVHFVAHELEFSESQNAFKKFKLALKQAANNEIIATFK